MKTANKTIWFDMDGTLCDLYKDPNWLEKIANEDITLYAKAGLLVNKNDFKKFINGLKNKGFKTGIITYLPWNCSKAYCNKVKKVKIEYIDKHFKNLFDTVYICDYTIPKSNFANQNDILIDDDKKNRTSWNIGKSYTHKNIINKIKKIYNIK